MSHDMLSRDALADLAGDGPTLRQRLARKMMLYYCFPLREMRIMCFGDGLNTMVRHECASLRDWAAAQMASHDFVVRDNAEGMTWVVLEPPAPRIDLLRFTICRIAPCVMVMVEDAGHGRRFWSAGNVEDAMAVVRNAADQAVLTAMNAHPAHRPLQ